MDATSEVALNKLGKRVNPPRACKHAKRTKLVISAASVPESGGRTPLEKLVDMQPVVRVQALSDDKINPEEQSALVLNSYVLEAVFSFLDYESLKNCRLVSNNWNKDASRELGKRSWFKNSQWGSQKNEDKGRKARTIWVAKNRYCHNSEYHNDKAYLREYAKDTLQLFKNISSSYLPQNVELTWKDLYHQNYQELIKTIGPFVKTLHIYKVIEQHSMKNLHNILTKWCPNLFNLKITMDYDVQGLCPCHPQPNFNSKWRKSRLWDESIAFGFTKPLSLKQFQIQTKCKLEHSGTQWGDYFNKMFLFCPDLESFKFTFENMGHKFDRIAEQESQLYGQVPTVFDVNKKLREILWDTIASTDNSEKSYCSNLNALKFVLQMNFPLKLKKFAFGPSTSIVIGNEKSPLQQFTQILNKLNFCGVEELLFRGCHFYRDFGSSRSVQVPLEDIPVMRTVKSINSTSDHNYGLGSIEFVTKFPNLVKLDINVYLYVDSDRFLEELNSLCRTPHKNLKILIAGFRIGKLSTLQSMMKCFPNLECLSIQALRISFQEAIMSTTSSLIHLKELRINKVSKYAPKDIFKALRALKNFPKLERLTLQGRSRFRKANMNFSNTKTVLEQLSGSSCFVRLVGHGIRDSEITKLENFSDKKRLRVQCQNDQTFLHTIDYNTASSGESDYRRARAVTKIR